MHSARHVARWRPGLLLGLLALVAPSALCAMDQALLPQYHLDVDLDTANHICRARQRVTWTNRHQRAAAELIFNAHSHYKLPDKDVGMTAKIFEILRVPAGDTLDLEGNALCVHAVRVLTFGKAHGMAERGSTAAPHGLRGSEEVLPPPRALPDVKPSADFPWSSPFHYQVDNDSALVVPLPRPVERGETVTVEIELELRLPEKQGRWGHFRGITFLTNWCPVLAYYDEGGWHPTPYVVWHQPFFNEAGLFSTRLVLPYEQKVACTAQVQSETNLGDGRRQIDFGACYARDFAIVTCAKYREVCDQSGPVRVRCLFTPGHEEYARFIVKCATEALASYTGWFGPYPYPELTIAESYFGWHSNECAGMVLLDSRIFDMPHLARAFVDYLVAQCTCHQWWYNLVGTNGYAETWMDEGVATYFAYRLMHAKYGRNDPLVQYPRGLRWLPNVYRNDYRYFNLYGTLARGVLMPTVQDMPKYEHIVDLYSMCYERGSKVVGMIEQRMGEGRFLDFMGKVCARHAWGMLRVADFRHDLEEYTGERWEEFFGKWVLGSGLTDWCVEQVKVEPLKTAGVVLPSGPRRWGWFGPRGACKATITLHQNADYDDPTILGICLDGGEGYQVRLRIDPAAGTFESSDPPAVVEPLGDHRVRVQVELPCMPTQIAVDPDEILVDRDPANNYWRPRCRVRFTPVYTFLDETDLTNAYDRWNVIFGPWLFAPTYDNPWFTRSTRVGFRAGAYRTQQFEGATYVAYRTDYRDFVEGVDGILYHWPGTNTEVGFVGERRLAGTLRGETDANRGVLYSRYVIDYGDSLYLPPFQYVEAFGTIQDDQLPFARESLPGATRFLHQGMGGLHYHINYLTPYWDAEGGFSMDLSYAGGIELPGEHQDIDGSHQLIGQFTYVYSPPDGFGWFSDSHFAFRVYGAYGLPNNVQYFALGGGELFRGFDLAQRQGSSLWVGSAEWRFPLVRHPRWSCCDRALTIENFNAAVFCDVGSVYLNNQSVGGVAKAVGAGLRIDLSWFTFVERTIIRFDVAKTLNSDAGPEFWAGLEHPF